MTREKIFEELAEEMGFADELPDTPDAYVRNIDKVEIDEIEFGDISNKIERRMEGFMRRLNRQYEECELVNSILEDEDLFSVDDWEYDRDKNISDIAKNIVKDNKEIWDKVVDITIDRSLHNENQVIGVINEEIATINEKFECNATSIKKVPKEYNGTINGFTVVLNGEKAFKKIKRSPVCSDLGLENIRKIAPIIYGVRKTVLNDNRAYEQIINRLKSTDRDEECKNLPKAQVSDFAIVTRNDDLSFACNPWTQEYFSDELKERIKIAQTRVKFDF